MKYRKQFMEVILANDKIVFIFVEKIIPNQCLHLIKNNVPTYQKSFSHIGTYLHSVEI